MVLGADGAGVAEKIVATVNSRTLRNAFRHARPIGAEHHRNVAASASTRRRRAQDPMGFMPAARSLIRICPLPLGDESPPRLDGLRIR